MTTDLRDKRATAWAEMQDLMATARGRSLTDAEQQRFDALEHDIRSANSQLSFKELGDEFGSVRIQPAAIEGTGQRAYSADGSVRVLKREERMASVVGPEAYDAHGLTIRGMLRAALSGDWTASRPRRGRWPWAPAARAVSPFPRHSRRA